jgi:hypothetical protein
MTYAQIRSTLIGAAAAFSLTTVSSSYGQQADSPALNPSHPDSYVVQSGDTLWDISAMFLRDPWYWPEIWQINPQVENPHLIYPGDVLSLAYLDGQPVIQLTRGEMEGGNTVRLSPRIRSEALTEAIPTIPYDTVAAFLSKPAVLDPSELDELPYVVAHQEGLLSSAGRDVYVRGTDADVGQVFDIVHTGDALIDPDDDEVIGYQGLYVGQGRVQRTGDPATVRLIESAREASVGDYLIVDETVPPINFFPRAPSGAVEGQIISVLDGVSMVGQYQVVVINRGARDGIEPGHVFSVYQRGETITDPTRDSGFSAEKIRLPDEMAGTTMVFRTFDRMSYALVMEATREMRVLDIIRNPNS